MGLDPTIILDYWPALLEGLATTLALLALSLAIGGPLAVVLAMAWSARSPLLSPLIAAFCYSFRGTPLLVQLFLLYYGFAQFETLKDTPLWALLKEGFWCAVIALAVNTSAYTAVILDGALRAVPRGEVEAARACGMSGLLLYRRILLPKALRIALPAYGNEVILLLKASSLASTVTVVELTGSAREIFERTYSPYEPLLAAGALYLVVTFLLTRIFRAVEQRLTPQRQRR